MKEAWTLCNTIYCFGKKLKEKTFKGSQPLFLFMEVFQLNKSDCCWTLPAAFLLHFSFFITSSISIMWHPWKAFSQLLFDIFWQGGWKCSVQPRIESFFSFVLLNLYITLSLYISTLSLSIFLYSLVSLFPSLLGSHVLLCIIFWGLIYGNIIVWVVGLFVFWIVENSFV